jgi:hypothetical protein
MRYSRARPFSARIDRLGPIAQHAVAADQIRVHICQDDRSPRQPSAVQQIEEHRGAAHERLDVARERRRVVLRQHGEKLSLCRRPISTAAGRL